MQIENLDAAFDEVQAAVTRDDMMLLSRFTRLTLPIVIWSPSPEALTVKSLRDCLVHWQELRADRQMPDWRDFRTEDFRDVVTRSTIVDPVPGSKDFRYRIIGSRLAEHLGQHWEGATIREIARARRSLGPILAHAVYVIASTRQVPVYTWHSSASRRGGVQGWHRLSLPFASDPPAEIRFVSVVEVEGAATVTPLPERATTSWQPRGIIPSRLSEPLLHK
ncbi:MAG: PAS domain-containing protein [Alphaproteobacteria bacterium]|nr:PAS domain-containing protein [Alphaproteobacteria bacterium]